MVGIYRTHEAMEAAWKYFILGSVGIALALFGTILVYLAARPVVGEGMDAMVWTSAASRAPQVSIPSLLNVAFVFLLLGYGTKVGLAPLHAWLPDAHAEGPTPISAVLSGLLLNVALYALLRFKMLLAANPGGIAPGPLMITLGLLSLIFAGVHAVPPARHQAAVRLLVDRAHGHHRVRLRHGRTARQFRRAVADDDAQPDQVGDLLLRRPRGAGEGHAAHRRDRRADREPSGAGLGLSAASPRSPDCRRSACSRASSCGQLHLCARAGAGGAAGVRPADRVRRADAAAVVGRVRRAARPERPVQASYVPIFAHLALVLIAGSTCRPPLVAWFQHVAALACGGRAMMQMEPGTDRRASRRGRASVDAEHGEARPRSRPATARCRPVGRCPAIATVHMALLDAGTPPASASFR